MCLTTITPTSLNSSWFMNVNTGLFTVGERGEMDSILKEQGFQASGCTDIECAVKIGKLLSANKMLVGEIGKLGTKFS